MTLFPLFLKLTGRTALVVGGGEIAESKIASLLHTGATVRVVAPRANAKVAAWAQERAITWMRRAFDPADLKSTFLVIAATSLTDVNHLVFLEARRRNILCNVVDDPPHCDFYFPAVVRRGDLQIAISTSGQSPALAQRLRAELESQFTPEYTQWVAEIGEQRRSILATQPPSAARKALLHQIVQKGPALQPARFSTQIDEAALSERAEVHHE